MSLPSFLPTPLDLGFDYSAAGGADDFGVEIARTKSGRAIATLYRSGELGEWQVGARNYDRAALDVLYAHWLVARGPAMTWPFKDWNDYTATDSVVEPLTESTAQLYRRYTVGAYSYDKKIVLPKVSTLTFKLNAAPLTVASVDATTGIVTFAEPFPGFESCPPDVVTWSGEYYKLARFAPGSRFNASFLAHEDRNGVTQEIFALSSLVVREELG